VRPAVDPDDPEEESRDTRFNPNSGETPVDTARLRALRTYPVVQALLRSFLLDQKPIPVESQLITAPGDLPTALRTTVDRAERNGRAWCAWRVLGEVCAITADVDEPGSRMYARPVLQVLWHDLNGRVIGASEWLETYPNHWCACATA
jgi:hypothetical protein